MASRQLTKKSTNGLDWTKRAGVVVAGSSAAGKKADDYIIGNGQIFILASHGFNNPFVYAERSADPTSWGGFSGGGSDDGAATAGFYDGTDFCIGTAKGSYFKSRGYGHGLVKQEVQTPNLMRIIALGKSGDDIYAVGFSAGSKNYSRSEIRYTSQFAVYKISPDWKTYEQIEFVKSGIAGVGTFDAMVAPKAMITDDGIYIAGFNYEKVGWRQPDGNVVGGTDGFHRYLTVVRIRGAVADVLVNQQYTGEFEIQMHKDGNNLIVVADKASLTLDANGTIIDSMVTSKDFTAAGYLHTGDSIRVTGTKSGKQLVELSPDGTNWKRYDKMNTDKYRPPKPTAVLVNLEI